MIKIDMSQFCKQIQLRLVIRQFFLLTISRKMYIAYKQVFCLNWSQRFRFWSWWWARYRIHRSETQTFSESGHVNWRPFWDIRALLWRNHDSYRSTFFDRRVCSRCWNLVFVCFCGRMICFPNISPEPVLVILYRGGRQRMFFKGKPNFPATQPFAITVRRNLCELWLDEFMKSCICFTLGAERGTVACSLVHMVPQKRIVYHEFPSR